MTIQAAQTPAPAPLPTLEQSFELLKEYKVGTDSTGLIPIERAVMEVHGNETARATLENLCRLWSRPVHVESVMDDEPAILSFDGTDHEVAPA